ncbi:MAG: shikimate dehydrogenase, partial [Planctomycetota bacterium]
AIPKLVYTADHINDCFEAFDLLRQSGGERIAFCMGQAGLISRIIAKKLGSLVTFASIDDKSATAPGQLTVEELKETYRFDKIDTDTELYGVMGSPVAHSLGPVVHNKCFSKIRANKLYLPIQLDGGKEEFETFMQKIIARQWLGLRGFSVTLPHKQNALSFVRRSGGAIESLTGKIDAANTLLVDRHGKVSAYNTDYAGALEAVTSVLKITNAKLAGFNVAVIGAGGVARAVVAGLSDVGAKITIYNRTVERGRSLADEFGCDFKPLDELSEVKAELLINCTSIGMHPDVKHSPLSKKHLRKDMAVFDTVYNPARTLLLKSAADKGAKTVDGLSMFVNQAAAQFKLFTGKQANTRFMRKTVSDCLTRK